MVSQTSLKNRIYSYINSRNYWINGGEIEKLAMETGYKASNASRRLRELSEDGVIDRKIDGSARSVWYKKLSTP